MARVTIPTSGMDRDRESICEKLKKSQRAAELKARVALQAFSQE